jgi:hypothetical protein
VGVENKPLFLQAFLQLQTNFTPLTRAFGGQRSGYAANLGIAASTNRKNRVLRARATDWVFAVNQALTLVAERAVLVAGAGFELAPARSEVNRDHRKRCRSVSIPQDGAIAPRCLPDRLPDDRIPR